jgi:hypothetical protein
MRAGTIDTSMAGITTRFAATEAVQAFVTGALVDMDRRVAVSEREAEGLAAGQAVQASAVRPADEALAAAVVAEQGLAAVADEGSAAAAGSVAGAGSDR